MKLIRLILALGAFFVAAVGLSACGSGVPGNAVADMAGNPVSTAAFNHWMYVAAKGNAAQSPGAPVIVPTDPPDFNGCISQVRKQIPSLASTSKAQLKHDCSQLFVTLASQVMDFLIRGYWYQAEAAKQHIKVTNAQVQQAFATARQQQFPTPTAFQSFLAQTGQTQQDILFRVRINQIYRMLLAKHPTTITPAAIQAYYASHSSQYGKPEVRDIRIVRTNSQQKAAAAKAALQSGQSWNTVAKQYSIDTQTKSKGGLIVGVTKGQEEQTLDNAAFSAPQNKVLGPIKGTFGYYVFEVTRIKPGTHQSLAQATTLIRQILQGQLQQSAQSAVDSQAKKDWRPKTKCRDQFAMVDCAGYKPPKSSTTTTPSTATPAPSTTTG